MFGYIKADKPDMRIRDYAVYRAYYCGLCKCIGKHNPPLMRFGVNYDITFLSMLAHNYAKLKTEFEDSRCLVHEMGRKFFVVKEDSVQIAVAEVNTILGYYKLTDDVSDGGKLKHKIVRAYVKGKYKRTARKHKVLDNELKRVFNEFDILEKSGSKDIDALARLSGEMLVAVARDVCPNADDNLTVLADNLGKWIYVIDAFDDLSKDIKQGDYNPLKPDAVTDEEFARIKSEVEVRLNEYVKNIISAYDKMDISVDEPPLSNVVYMGIPVTTEDVLANGGKKCQKTLL